MGRRYKAALVVVLLLGVVGGSVTTREVGAEGDSAVSSVVAQYSALMTLEQMKMSVLEDIRAVVLLKTPKEYKEVKDRVHFTEEYRSLFFGTTYNEYRYVKADKVSFIDAQYTIPSADSGYSLEDTDIRYTIEAYVTRGEDTKVMRFLVIQRNGLVYDIQVF